MDGRRVWKQWSLPAMTVGRPRGSILAEIFINGFFCGVTFKQISYSYISLQSTSMETVMEKELWSLYYYYHTMYYETSKDSKPQKNHCGLSK